MFRLIAIAVGIYFAAKALRPREGAPEARVTRFSDGPSEEEVEQELRERV